MNGRRSLPWRSSGSTDDRETADQAREALPQAAAGAPSFAARHGPELRVLALALPEDRAGRSRPSAEHPRASGRVLQGQPVGAAQGRVADQHAVAEGRELALGPDAPAGRGY